MKIEVTEKYLNNILQALEDAKGLCQAYGFKNSFGKHINATKKIIKKYRDTTNKNKDLDNFTIQYKLNREFYSSSADSINEDRDICYYGYLKINKSNKTNTITDIHNSKSNRCGRIKDDVKGTITEIYKSVFGGDL